ncbi:MAG: hypothetical protein ABJJ53_19545 [Sulfitobacter sp.]
MTHTASDVLDFTLTGTLSSPDFIPWMNRQAGKLGVTYDARLVSAARMQITAEGAPEMLEAFALACSLGPSSVMIDELLWGND